MAKKEKAARKPKPPARKKVRPAYVDLVVPPEPFVSPAGAGYEGDVYVWDLDRTYLRTEFDSLRDLIRTALQKAKDKIAYPGVAALMRALRRGPAETDGAHPVYFISASPPQIRKVVGEKFALDRVEVDGVYFKDNLRNVRPGRMRRLREQVGYKLLALLDLKSRLPAKATLTCFGDDFESDALIYSLYGEISEGWIGRGPLVEFLAKQGVFHDEAVRIAWKTRHLPASKTVGRIFIHMHGETADPRYWRRFGTRVTATRNYFQTAMILFSEGKISAGGLTEVGEEVLSSRTANPYDLAGSAMDLVERRVIGEEALARLAAPLVEKSILPVGFP